MNICLAYESLLHAYQMDAFEFSGPVIGRDARVGKTWIPKPFSPAISRHEAEALRDDFGFEFPIHTLASDSSCRSKSSYLQCHLWGCSSVGDSVLRVADGLYLGSPEMMFVQMCGSLSFHQAVRLGFDLCGTYRRSNVRTTYNRQSITTVSRLNRYAGSLRKADGLGCARKALRYVLDNSYSPRETDLAMKLSLPCVYGGEGFGGLEMNREIVLSNEAAHMLSQRVCKCDLYWPKEKVAVEYNGFEDHHGRDQSTHDRKRELALNSMGIKVITVANEQLINPSQFDFVAHQVAKALGKRIRHRASQYAQRRYELDSLIRGWSGPNN